MILSLQEEEEMIYSNRKYIPEEAPKDKENKNDLLNSGHHSLTGTNGSTVPGTLSTNSQSATMVQSTSTEHLNRKKEPTKLTWWKNSGKQVDPTQKKIFKQQKKESKKKRQLAEKQSRKKDKNKNNLSSSKEALPQKIYNEYDDIEFIEPIETLADDYYTSDEEAQIIIQGGPGGPLAQLAQGGPGPTGGKPETTQKNLVNENNQEESMEQQDDEDVEEEVQEFT